MTKFSLHNLSKQKLFEYLKISVNRDIHALRLYAIVIEFPLSQHRVMVLFQLTAFLQQHLKYDSL